MVEQTRIWAPPYAGFMRDQIQNRWEVGGRFICFSSVIVESGWKGASCGDRSRVGKAMWLIGDVCLGSKREHGAGSGNVVTAKAHGTRDHLLT